MKQFQSAKKEKIDNIGIDSNIEKVKTKQRFDLNLSKLTKNQSVKFENFEMDVNENGQLDPASQVAVTKNHYTKQSKKKLRIGGEPIITEFMHKKQIKTVQNSNESSQHSESTKNILVKGRFNKNHKMGITTITNSNDDRNTNKQDTNHQELNQSFSLRNIQQNAEINHEVESLMMNNQILQTGPTDRPLYNEQATNHAPSAGVCILIDPQQSHQSLRPSEPARIRFEKGKLSAEAKPLNESQSQQIITGELLNAPADTAGQSLNQSSLNESMAQSGVSMTQNSKKGVIPNFKLDLSKCKNVEGDFVEADPGFVMNLPNEEMMG
jgi:hypothetical protein